MTEPSVPGLYAGVNSRGSALPSCGKYWGLRLGRWVRVKVLALPAGSFAGRMRCDGPGLGGNFWGPEVGLQDCAAFWGRCRIGEASRLRWPKLDCLPWA